MRSYFQNFEWRLLLAVIATGAVGESISGVLPVVVGALIEHLSFSAAQAGQLVGAEVAAGGLAVAIFSSFTGIMRRRFMAYLGACMAIAAGVASIFVTDYWPLLILRAAAGFSAGIVSTVNGATIAAAKEPERILAASMVVGIGGMTILMGFLPMATDAFGVAGAYGGLICLILIWFPALWLVPAGPREGAPLREALEGITKRTGTGSGALMPVLMIIVMVFILIAETGAWGFAERKGHEIGMSAESVGFALALMFGLSLLGSFGALALGNRWGRGWPFVLGMFGHTVGLYMAMTATDGVTYTVGLIIWNVTFIFAVPYLFGTLSEIDKEGRWVSISIAVFIFANAFGPAFAGWVMDDASDFWALLQFTITFQIIGMVLAVPVFWKVEQILKASASDAAELPDLPESPDSGIA